jgi:hypothetical protein
MTTNEEFESALDGIWRHVKPHLKGKSFAVRKCIVADNLSPWLAKNTIQCRLVADATNNPPDDQAHDRFRVTVYANLGQGVWKKDYDA